MSLRISVLDQLPVVEGGTPADAIRSAIRLATELDGLGITRYWVTGSGALAAAILASTRQLSVVPLSGDGQVAEAARVLDALFPGRVDVGISRGSQPLEAFREEVSEVRRELDGSGAGTWVFGLGDTAASVAGSLGVNFCFGQYLNPSGGALARYRELGSRHTSVAVNVIASDSAARATDLARAYFLWRSRRDLDIDEVIPSVDTARLHAWTSAERSTAAGRRESLIFGPIERVRAELLEVAATHEVDELVVNTLVHDPADRLRSYQLLAEAFGLSHSQGAIAA